MTARDGIAEIVAWLDEARRQGWLRGERAFDISSCGLADWARAGRKLPPVSAIRSCPAGSCGCYRWTLRQVDDLANWYVTVQPA